MWVCREAGNGNDEDFIIRSLALVGLCDGNIVPITTGGVSDN